MNIGELMKGDNGPKIKAGVAGLVLLVGLVLIFRSITPPAQAEVGYWYFDLNTGKYFAAAGELAPINTPSPGDQPAGVRARLFSCGSCAKEADRMLGWLEKFSPEGKTKLGERFRYTDANELMGEIRPGDLLGKRTTDASEKWVECDGEFTVPIMEELAAKCGGKTPTACETPSTP